MYLAKKVYRDIPIAHRQWRHTGHCANIHGHNISVEFEFSCEKRDERGFVIDFGELGELKKAVESFDHVLILQSQDPMLYDHRFKSLTVDFEQKVEIIADVSCEGMAKHFYEVAELFLEDKDRFGREVYVYKVTVYEDGKNSASYLNEFKDV